MGLEEYKHLFAVFAGALSVYAGIRADLQRLHKRVEEAHERINQLLLMKGATHGNEKA